MKRPISHFLVPLACLCMLPFCLQPGSALGGDKTRGYSAGKFQMDIGNHDAGWIQSVEGGTASSDTVQEKLGPVPKTTVQAPRNLQPQTQQLATPACPHPPCGLGNAHTNQQQSLGDLHHKQQEAQDEKDEAGDVGEETSTQIQEYQNRRQKAFEALSNTQKKSSDTQSGIISNMK